LGFAFYIFKIMSVRSLNKVMLIGNLTRDPELRFTPSGTAVCSFGLATNRSWTTESGEKKEETEFHRIVSWNKLAELCNQLLTKGRKIFVEGRLQTRSWQGQDGTQRTSTEIVIDDMIILDSRRIEGGMMGGGMNVPKVPQSATVNPTNIPAPIVSAPAVTADQKTPVVQVQDKAKEPVKETKTDEAKPNEDINPDDIPF
jgi:single-strand DNA-binding protein